MAVSFDQSMPSALAIARAVRLKRARVAEVLEAALTRIDRLNPAVNAIVTLDKAGARRGADDADGAIAREEAVGPLHGVPITIKDSFDTAGLRTTAGYPLFAGRVPEVDADAVARLRTAGAIIVGKTNLPPLARGLQTDNRLFGRTNNPWDPGRTPGGSSGGAAASVCAGLSALDLGSDVGGSIRIPAHFCGVYGLKATGGRISGRGHVASTRPLVIPDAWHPLLELAAFGPLARSVPDLRTAFRAVANPGTPGLDAVPGRRPLADLRIAWSEEFGGALLDADSRVLMRRFVDTLAARGAQIEHTEPAGLDYDDAWETAGELLGSLDTLFQAPARRMVRRVAAVFAAVAPRTPLVRGLYAGAALNAARIGRALERRLGLIERLDRFLASWDAWVCPVFPTPAFTHRPPHESIEVDGVRVAQLEANLLHTVLFNVTGSPVVALPIGRTAQGLPVGVQLVGRRWGEMALLDVAEELAIAGSGYAAPPLGPPPE